MSKYYLVSVDTFECVYFRAILGVAETKSSSRVIV